MTTTKQNISALIRSAKEERRALASQVVWLDRVIANYEKLLPENKKVVASKGVMKQKPAASKNKGTWSQAARAKHSAKFSTPTMRAAVSERMKKYWAKRRANGQLSLIN